MHFDYVWVLSEHLQHPVYCVEANEPPLHLRRKKLSLQYCLKLSSNQSNPTYNSVFNSKFISVFERKPTQLPPLAVRVSCDMKQIGFKKSDVVLSVIPSTPPWLLTRPVIDLSWTSTARTKAILLPKFLDIIFMNYVIILRTITASLLMALKRATELQLP